MRPLIGKWVHEAFAHIATCRRLHQLAWRHLNISEDQRPTLLDECMQRYAAGTLWEHTVGHDPLEDAKNTGQLVEQAEEDDTDPVGTADHAPETEEGAEDTTTEHEQTAAAHAALSKAERLFFLKWAYGSAPPKA